jgi:hypothetical protein
MNIALPRRSKQDDLRRELDCLAKPVIWPATRWFATMAKYYGRKIARPRLSPCILQRICMVDRRDARS